MGDYENRGRANMVDRAFAKTNAETLAAWRAKGVEVVAPVTGEIATVAAEVVPATPEAQVVA